ncbi:MAG: hypothetical protein HKN05_00520, partial [Rhizobiales bacterium]|nr:hypothetical protein [Hyphomicrobiales bacterium]
MAGRCRADVLAWFPQRSCKVSLFGLCGKLAGANFGRRNLWFVSSNQKQILNCEEARRRRNHVTSLDKSNVMESGKLWREAVSRIGADEYPDVG